MAWPFVCRRILPGVGNLLDAYVGGPIQDASLVEQPLRVSRIRPGDDDRDEYTRTDHPTEPNSHTPRLSWEQPDAMWPPSVLASPHPDDVP